MPALRHGSTETLTASAATARGAPAGVRPAEARGRRGQGGEGRAGHIHSKAEKGGRMNEKGIRPIQVDALCFRHSCLVPFCACLSSALSHFQPSLFFLARPVHCCSCQTVLLFFSSQPHRCYLFKGAQPFLASCMHVCIPPSIYAFLSSFVFPSFSFRRRGAAKSIHTTVPPSLQFMNIERRPFNFTAPLSSTPTHGAWDSRPSQRLQPPQQ